jgi:hypothetical protein
MEEIEMETATPAVKGRGKAKLYDLPLVSFQNEKVAITQLSCQIKQR